MNKAALPALGLAALFALTACGGNDTAQSSTTTQTPASASSTPSATAASTEAMPQGGTTTEPAEGAATTAEAQGTAQPGASTDGQSATAAPAASAQKQCSGQTGQQAAEANINKVPGPGASYGEAHWIVPNTDLSRFDDCAALGAIPVTINGGTSSSPWQIMLFSHGRYIGTATEKAYGWDPAITRLSDNSIQVTCSYAQGDDANGAPSGKATSVFTIDGSGHVTRTGELPPK